MKPKRIQLSRKKGWRKPANTVVVSRPSKWGNPYRVGFEVLTTEEAVRKFRVFLAGSGFPQHRERMGDVRQLRGKNLACWCALWDEKGLRIPCHADVLLEMANV